MILELRCGAKVESDNVPPDAAEFQCSRGCVHKRSELEAGPPPMVPRLRTPSPLRPLKPFAVPAGVALAVVGYIGSEADRPGAELLGVAGVLLMLWGGFFKHAHDEE